MITLSRAPVESDPEKMGGTLVFRETRVPAQTLLDYLIDGYTLEEFLDSFEGVERADAEEFLRLVRAGNTLQTVADGRVSNANRP